MAFVPSNLPAKGLDLIFPKEKLILDGSKCKKWSMDTDTGKVGNCGNQETKLPNYDFYTRCAGSHGVFDAKKWLQERKTTPRVGQAYPEQPLLLG